jgi:hypothetical protein
MLSTNINKYIIYPEDRDLDLMDGLEQMLIELEQIGTVPYRISFLP